MMQSLLKRIERVEIPLMAVPAALLVLAFLAYGLLFAQLGFYWDDLPISWIRYQFGPEVMHRYFSTNRPVWGELYQITTRLLPQVPAIWQLFAVFWRWMTAVLCWILFLELWPARRKLALSVSMLFLLYPGFDLQWVSFLTSHFFIVLCFFLLSYVLMIRSFYPPTWLPGAWPFTVGALLFSALNVWMMEHFFFLELMRPFFILALLHDRTPRGNVRDWKALAARSLVRWLPYVAVWMANVFYRMFIFTNLAYGNVLLKDLRNTPMVAIETLLVTIVRDLWLVSARAWLQILHFPGPSIDGPITTLLYAGVVLSTGLVAGVLLARARDQSVQNRNGHWVWPIVMGLIAMLLAGGPYWLAKLELTLHFPADRFTISFMLGVSLVLGGLLGLLPQRAFVAVAALLIGLAAGRQALAADSFRRDWTTQKALFWQMTWRAPGLEPNTMVLLNEGPLVYYSDNSIGAALNWIYDPDHHDPAIRYALFFPTSRVGGTLDDLQSGLSVVFPYPVATFHGSTSQAVAFYYEPPRCLRLLNPDMDSTNRLIPADTFMREAAELSSAKWILSEGSARMPAIYRPEPAHGWCYYFEKAELAGQFGEWGEVTRLGDIAFRLNDYPNDPVERFVFIEAYAREGNLERAMQLTDQSYHYSPEVMRPLVCRLWERLAKDPQMEESSATIGEIEKMLACESE